MKNFLIAFFVFLIYSIFGMWYYSCWVKGLCGDNSIAIEKSSASKEKRKVADSKSEDAGVVENTISPFTYTSGDLTFDFPDNIGLKLNSDKIDFADADGAFKQSVFEFLNKNQGKEMVIIGLLNNPEANLNDQLGINRANQVKTMLTNYGINPNRLKLESKQTNFDYNENGIYTGGVLFDFEDLSEEALIALESSIENKILYSGFASKEFAPDNTLQAYALELKNYLVKYPAKTAQIVGHTDNTGKWEANEWYGMERAKNVKKYLESLGIDANRLVASSKGESQPIVSNATIEGRRKNRRIEIKVN